MLLPLQGVTNERTLTQGVASLALGYVLLPFQGVLAKSETLFLNEYNNYSLTSNSPDMSFGRRVSRRAERREDSVSKYSILVNKGDTIVSKSSNIF